jgi:hypothetical protein
MNVITLSLVPHRTRPGDQAVAIRIDAECLIDRVLRIETDYWQAIGADPTSRHYTWVRARDMLLPSRHLLGVPAGPPWFPGFSELLICSCGEAACRAIAVRVRVWPSRVGWLAWRQFPAAEACPRTAFSPLLFDREQYEGELVRVSEEYRRTTGWSNSATP